MASVAIRDVRKAFGLTAVIHGVDVSIEDGEFVVLVGPSGCGKSTLLRMIAGLENITGGEISIGDRVVNHLPPKERDVAMVFQNYALYPHKSVHENLAFGLRVRKIDAARIDERVRATAATLGIDGLLDRKPAQLSGGQRQRVALGRAIVREPKAFLLDEPLSNLDPLLRVATRAELALLHRRLAATMVYVTHDQEEAMTLGTRVAVMRDGVIEQVASPREVYGAPANTFVAGFVGSPSMNLWPSPDEAGVLLGVRPHDIDIVAPSDADVVGQAVIVEPLGPVTLIHLSVKPLTDQLVRVVVPADAPIAVDDRAGFRVRKDRVLRFDTETGRRLA